MRDLATHQRDPLPHVAAAAYDVLCLTDVFSAPGDGTARVAHTLERVHVHLRDVVQQREDRRQRECGDEERDEGKLDHYT